MKKKRRLKESVVMFLVSAAMSIGWYVMMFPVASDLVNRIFNQNSILSYHQSMSSYSDEEMADLLRDCMDYNQSIYEEQQESEFRYRGPTATGEDYMKVPTNSTGICTIRIPSIDVNLQVVHGTSDNDLQSSAGHLYGTSLPVEGESVHAVIAAHSALSTAKLFTDLPKIQEGDIFYITILNREYEYTVDQIVTVLPEDDYKYEQIEEGKNYVTLYTCTPYGVNTHRLLVRGEMTGIQETHATEDVFTLGELMPVINRTVELMLIVLLPFIVLIAGRMRNRRKHKRVQERKEENHDRS